MAHRGMVGQLSQGNLMEETFEPVPASARAVRQLVREEVPEGPLRDDILLVASELASNVIVHARTDFVVQVTSEAGRIRIEVWNGSSIIPAVKLLRDSGYGLRVVEALSDRWGVESVDTGKAVWAEFRS